MDGGDCEATRWRRMNGPDFSGGDIDADYVVIYHKGAVQNFFPKIVLTPPLLYYIYKFILQL